MEEATKLQKWSGGNNAAATVLDPNNSAASERLLRTGEITEGHKFLNTVFMSMSTAHLDGSPKYSYYHYRDKLSKDGKYTIKDIESFYSLLKKYHERDMNAGVFLSAAISVAFENNTDKALGRRIKKVDPAAIASRVNKVRLVNKEAAINGLCFELDQGTVKIEGPAGHKLGMGMRGGTVMVKGPALDFLGLGMLGGSIIVQGHVGKYACSGMQNGDVTVLKNADGFAGRNMNGGTLTILGAADDGIGMDSSCDARIFVFGTYNKLAANPRVIGDIDYLMAPRGSDSWKKLYQDLEL
ncbi:MAG: hypothetical protein ABSA33_02025 [Candidatus Micrarchaeaceae archaeon]|jgi:hypothetical protein